MLNIKNKKLKNIEEIEKTIEQFKGILATSASSSLDGIQKITVIADGGESLEVRVIHKENSFFDIEFVDNSNGKNREIIAELAVFLARRHIDGAEK